MFAPSPVNFCDRTEAETEIRRVFDANLISPGDILDPQFKLRRVVATAQNAQFNCNRHYSGNSPDLRGITQFATDYSGQKIGRFPNYNEGYLVNWSRLTGAFRVQEDYVLRRDDELKNGSFGGAVPFLLGLFGLMTIGLLHLVLSNFKNNTWANNLMALLLGPGLPFLVGLSIYLNIQGSKNNAKRVLAPLPG